jgi:23S rRNA pseudouridine2604 synthase
MNEPIRLSKRVVELMRCSRMEAEHYVQDGWVTVDGVVVEEPQHRVVAEQAVVVHPDARLVPPEPATILLSKPAGVAPGDEALALIKPASRWAEDASDIRTLNRHRLRLVPMFPLETFASGLAVFTQDRRVMKRIDEEGGRIEHEMIAEVTGTIAAGGLELLASGMRYEGRVLPPAKVSWQNEDRLRFAIKAPQPGQIAHMCRQVGLEVVSLKRLRLGRIPLAKMPPGEWRYLPVDQRF